MAPAAASEARVNGPPVATDAGGGGGATRLVSYGGSAIVVAGGDGAGRLGTAGAEPRAPVPREVAAGSGGAAHAGSRDMVVGAAHAKYAGEVARLLRAGGGSDGGSTTPPARAAAPVEAVDVHSPAAFVEAPSPVAAAIPSNGSYGEQFAVTALLRRGGESSADGVAFLRSYAGVWAHASSPAAGLLLPPPPPPGPAAPRSSHPAPEARAVPAALAVQSVGRGGSDPFDSDDVQDVIADACARARAVAARVRGGPLLHASFGGASMPLRPPPSS